MKNGLLILVGAAVCASILSFAVKFVRGSQPGFHFAEGLVDVPSEDLFRFASDIDSWPAWHDGIDCVAHLPGDDFKAVLRMDGQDQLHSFAADFEKMQIGANVDIPGVGEAGRWSIDVDPVDARSSRISVTVVRPDTPPSGFPLRSFRDDVPNPAGEWLGVIKRHCHEGNCSIEDGHIRTTGMCASG